ncbi:MAG: hypothetical protein V4587_17145, partial [Acidobacteriota bacterium]
MDNILPDAGKKWQDQTSPRSTITAHEKSPASSHRKFPVIGEETLRHANLLLSALFVLVVFTVLPSAHAQQQDTPPMLGFSSATAKTEADLEKRFAAIPDPQR